MPSYSSDNRLPILRQLLRMVWAQQMTNVLNQLVNIKAHAEMEHDSSNEDKKVLHAAQRLDEPINIISPISVLIPSEQRAVDDLKGFHGSIQWIYKADRLISREMKKKIPLAVWNLL